MTDKHTTEPWTVFSNPGVVKQTREYGIRGVVEFYEGQYIVEVNTQLSDADARRIVACVNACAGIPTTFLEGGAVGWLGARIRRLTEHYHPPMKAKFSSLAAFEKKPEEEGE